MTSMNRKELEYPFLHVVTGTPGMGKSASRYPFITLLMGFGVRDITTKKDGECAFVFRQVNKTSAGYARIATENLDGENITLKVPTYFYHYDVYAFNNGGAQKYNSGSKSESKSTPEATYDPATIHNILNYRDKPYPVLGQLIVPSVEYFTRFLRLMLGNNTHDFSKYTETEYDITVTAPSCLKEGSVIAKDSILFIQGQEQAAHFHQAAPILNDLTIEAGSIVKADSMLSPGSSLVYFSVRNRLEGTGWHVIDEFVFLFVIVSSLTVLDSTSISEREHCVLFTSPQGSRWTNMDPKGKSQQYLIAEYVVPKYLLLEEAALLNTMGQTEELQGNVLNQLEEGLRMFSFVPRLVLEPGRTARTLTLIAEADTKTDEGRQQFFASCVSHNLMHFSCPQYDCHNWYVQFPTESARQFVLEMFNLETPENYNEFLASLAKHHGSNPINDIVFHNFVLDAIAGGLFVSSPTRIFPDGSVNCESFTLPTIMGESPIHLRSSSNIRRANLPDISRIDHSELQPFLSDYNVLFENPMLTRSMQSAEIANQNEAPPTSTNILNSESVQPTSGMLTRSRAKMNTLTPKLSRSSSNFSSKTDDPNIKCFTYSLNPQGANHAGFHSIVLFFKVHVEKQKLVIDALSVMFIQSTLSSHCSISSSDSNLMFLWLALFSNVYNLAPSVIFPFLFFVKSSFVVDFRLLGENPSKFFMDRRNIWVLNGPTSPEETVEVKYRERLALDSVASLIPNTHPNCFRCCFCKQVLKADFSNHRCQRLRSGEPIKSSEQLISSPWAAFSSGMGKVGVYDRENPQVTFKQEDDSRRMMNVFFTLAIENKPNDASGHSSTTNCGEYGINLNCTKTGLSPNSSDYHNRLDMIDVVLVAPTDHKDHVFPLIDASPEPEPHNDSFEVTYDGPILDLFSYSTRQPVDTTMITDPEETVSVDATVLQNLRDDRDAVAEVEHPTSRLHESLELLRLWGTKKAIGFTKTEKKRHAYAADISQPPFDNVDLLCQNGSIPLSQMFVPMDCLNRLPVNLYYTRALVPFEIKCILNAIASTVRLDLKHFSLQNHLKYGQPMALEDLEKVVGDKVVSTHLLTKCLIPLCSHRPTKMNLNINDLSQLVSYVNGSYLIVADILQLCMKYLNRSDQLTPSDLTYLLNYLENHDFCKRGNPKNQVSPSAEAALVQQAFWNDLHFRVSQSLRYFSFDRSSFIGSLDGEPILSGSILADVRNLVNVITLNRLPVYDPRDLFSKLTKHKTTIDIRLNFMETCLKHGLNIVKEQLQLLVAQVIEKQPLLNFTNEDRVHLIGQYRTNPLLSTSHRLLLIPFFFDVSQLQEKKDLIHKLSGDSPLTQHDICFLYTFLTIQTPLDDQETEHLGSVVDASNSNIPKDGQTKLIELITGDLRSGQETFHRLSNTPNYKAKWCATMKKLELNQHEDLDRAFLRDCLEMQHPLEDSEKDQLSSLIEESTLSAKEKDTLHSLVDGKPIFSQSHREQIVRSYLRLQERTELALSDEEIAVQCVFHPLDSAEQDISLLFKILKGEEHVSEQRQRVLIAKMHQIRERILQTKKDLCDRLGKDGRFSWMDLASLLCSPNGDRSKSLAAIRSLCESGPTNPKDLDDVAIASISDYQEQPQPSQTPPRPTTYISDPLDLEEQWTPLFSHRTIIIERNPIDKRSGSCDWERL
ncbi:hypothetical protein BLNAU_8970 [Blattamonas nauphoetae]|uniref:Uncharacterized protein n=1 Tax=Blattamonas nauphoetae TaxID=2049346 RepID=A0ABQ9XWY3_9EUKA|nr:hypothetical protein BLNAU_8970 [Blattamonas nauphoetae]